MRRKSNPRKPKRSPRPRSTIRLFAAAFQRESGTIPIVFVNVSAESAHSAGSDQINDSANECCPCGARRKNSSVPRRHNLSRVTPFVGRVLPARGRKGYQGRSPWLVRSRIRYPLLANAVQRLLTVWWDKTVRRQIVCSRRSVATETRLRGWACETRTQKCRRKI